MNSLVQLLICALYPVDRLKKYLKYIAIIALVLLSRYMLSTTSEDSKSEDKINPALTDVAVEPEPSVHIERFSETSAQKVTNKLDSLLKRINKRHDFHGSVMVVKNNKILYDSHIGKSDFRKKELIDGSCAFQLASVSKQFTAAAIMLLYEKKMLQLTDTITDYFPEFPYAEVTIKNLLNHTAGLPKYFWIAEHKWEQEKAPTNSELMDLMVNSDVERFFRPGRNFDYSNTGYFVLASLVEKVSGLSFGEFMEEEIFKPLGMNNSYVYSFENDPVRENQLIGYRLYRGWRHIKINGTVNDAVVGDKNVYSNTEDLYKWIVGLNTGKLLSQESLDMMYSKGETVYGRKVPYGFGFRIDTQKTKSIYHHGKWNGFSTSLMQYPEDDLVVIVLEHTSYNAMTSLNKKIKQLVLNNFTG